MHQTQPVRGGSTRHGGWQRLLCLALCGLWWSSCSDTPDAVPEPQWRLPATDAFVQRQQDYLDHCVEGNGPGKGGRHGHVCLVEAGIEAYDRDELDGQFAKIRRRQDTSDFDLTSLLRMLYLDRKTGALPDDVRSEIEAVVLGFKYWLDEPGPDKMVWWSENHQILFHALEYLAGHLFYDRIFSNSGMTGAEHVAHARPRLLRWMRNRARFGFSEFHSNVYFNEDMPPLLNLVDFAPDEAIRAKATILLDTLMLDMASNYFKGRFATAHGRTYPDRLLNGLDDSTTEAAWLLFGGVPLTEITQLGAGNFTGAFLATSEHYNPPPLLEAYADQVADGLEHRQRDSIRVEDGPDWGIGYREWHDVMFWWGMTGYIAPEIISGSFRMVDNFNMWEGETWEDLSFLQPLVGTSVLQTASAEFSPLSRGIVLEEANTYVYRTPHYQMAGVQDYKPSSWTGQVHVWKATLGPDAYVFTTYPGGSAGDYAGGDWTGGFVPRATLDGAVAIVQYRRPTLPKVADRLLEFAETAGFGLDFKDYSHAYFPKHVFDETVTAANWTFGRSGDAWVGIWSQHPVTWSTDNQYELIAAARENVWVVHLGSRDEQSSFAAFVDALNATDIGVDAEGVHVRSPWQGRYRVGWHGPMTKDGEPIDLGPYDRWDNPYIQQTFGTRASTLTLDGQQLQWDFDAARRIEIP